MPTCARDRHHSYYYYIYIAKHSIDGETERFVCCCVHYRTPTWSLVIICVAACTEINYGGTTFNNYCGIDVNVNPVLMIHQTYRAQYCRYSMLRCVTWGLKMHCCVCIVYITRGLGSHFRSQIFQDRWPVNMYLYFHASIPRKHNFPKRHISMLHFPTKAIHFSRNCR